MPFLYRRKETGLVKSLASLTQESLQIFVVKPLLVSSYRYFYIFKYQHIQWALNITLDSNSCRFFNFPNIWIFLAQYHSPPHNGIISNFIFIIILDFELYFSCFFPITYVSFYPNLFLFALIIPPVEVLPQKSQQISYYIHHPSKNRLSPVYQSY